MNHTLNRRDFLKLTSLMLGGAFLPPLPPAEAPRQVTGLGRLVKGLYIYDRPSLKARPIKFVGAETLVNIFRTVESEDKHYNRQWYEIQQGYIHSATVQPVEWREQIPTLEIPKEGVLTEVSVPFTTSRTAPDAKAGVGYRLYYSTTHWAMSAKKDAEGRIWYRIFDDYLKTHFWVRGEHLRRISAEEVMPISPDVKDKRIEIDLAKQTFRCLEGDKVVLDTLCSTGVYLRTENGKPVYGTPAGEWIVDRKRPSRHMAGDEPAAEGFYDLPGVPWVSYFHWWGVSIHGTYWHNDYGEPHSHGCINLLPETAKWVYRWTMPIVGFTEQEVINKENGTQVLVF